MSFAATPSARRTFLSQISPLSQEQFDFKPGFDDWSVGEVVHHIALTEQVFQDTGQKPEKWLELSKGTFEFATRVAETFYQGDAMTKKTILASSGSNLVLKDKKLCIEAIKPFLILENALHSSRGQNRAIEPKNAGSIPQHKGSPELRRPFLWGQRDEVRTFGPNEKRIVKQIYHFFRSLPDPGTEYLFLRRN